MEDKQFFATRPKEGGTWDVAIIGSGPAGLTAAIYTTRGAASTLVLAGEMWGGQLMLTTTVDNFPGFPDGIQGPELMSLMRKQAERFGAEFIEEDVESVDLEKKPFEIIAGGNTYKARSIIIATGAKTKWLEVPGENKLRGRGVSSCAPCDAPFFKDKNVAVVGGGDAAMEEALILTKYASSVAIIHRRDEFRASAVMQNKVIEMQKQGKIEIFWSTEVVELMGNQKLEKAKFRTKLDSSFIDGLKKEIEVKGKILGKREEYLFWELPLDGLFVAIGHIPASSIFKGHIDIDEKGYIKKVSSENGYKMSTSVEGVFVAGDVHDYHFRQAITAAGFGCMAAMEVLKYLDKSTPSW